MRIVVVDPSRTVLKAVRRLLEEAMHEVCSFEDGRRALDYIRSDHEVRALITSVELPVLSGIELCRELRRLSSAHRPLYILLMSSRSDQGHLIKALDSGADDFICKPPAAEELYARLRVADRVTTMQADLVRLAMTDSLTGACTRRAFFQRAVDASARAEAGSALAAVMFDIDHFKNINDAHGHEAGDEVLRGVAREAAKVGGTIGRLGGEEFSILVEASLQDAVELADNLRRAISSMRFCASGTNITVTCSFGVSAWRSGDSIDRLLKRADTALYEAKRTSRNRVVADLCMRQRHWHGVVRSSERPPAHQEGHS
jgi:two-component system, cell cycle response regulator